VLRPSPGRSVDTASHEEGARTSHGQWEDGEKIVL